MWSRSRLDIGWGDLCAAAVAAARPVRVRAEDIAARWDPEGAVFLTVRTAWDALLAELAADGGEAVVSAINIPDMFELLEHHGLEPVPAEVDPVTLAPPPGALAARINSRTRLVLVTHLLGARVDMDAVYRELDDAGVRLPVIEDCAQAFEDLDDRGHPRSLAALYSFGPIKTSSALGGCLARVNDARLRQRMLARARAYPQQSRLDYLATVAKYGALKAMSTPSVYATFVHLCELLGRSHDEVINGAVMGLAGDDYWAALRRRPAAPLLATLERRLLRFDGQHIARRREYGDRLARELRARVTVLGADASRHSWWKVAIASDDPDALIARLRAAGFDATAGSSRLGCPPPPTTHPDPCPRARAAMNGIVYVPAYPELPVEALARLAELIAGPRTPAMGGA